MKKLLTYYKEKGIERVTEQFTWTKVARKCIEVYDQVILAQSDVPITQHWQHAELLSQSFTALQQTIERSKLALRIPVLDAVRTITDAFEQGNKLLICGNGGSAADAQHFAGELTGRFIREVRPGLPAISLTADTAFLTAWSNDFHYDHVFARQVEALGKAGDVLVGISTSGNSQNIIEAFKVAKRQGITCIGLLGKNGGKMLSLCDIALVIPSDETTRIQEMHLAIIHAICTLIEHQLFPETGEYTCTVHRHHPDRVVPTLKPLFVSEIEEKQHHRILKGAVV